jgi:hypothetical protein
MIPEVVEARHVKDFVVWVRFSDGVEGEVNLKNELKGDIFKPLLDVSYFKQFTVHEEFRTLTWPNGADVAPEYLYKKIKVPA